MSLLHTASSIRMEVIYLNSSGHSTETAASLSSQMTEYENLRRIWSISAGIFLSSYWFSLNKSINKFTCHIFPFLKDVSKQYDGFNWQLYQFIFEMLKLVFTIL